MSPSLESWLEAKERGNRHFKAQEYASAIAAYDDSVRLHGDAARGAAAVCSNNKADDAAEDTSDSDAAAPLQTPPPAPSEAAPVLSNRSCSWAKLGNWHDAQIDARKCVELDPQFLRGYARLSAALAGHGNFAGASAALRDGIAVATRKKDLTMLSELRSMLALTENAERAMNIGQTALMSSAAAGSSSAPSGFIMPGGSPGSPGSPVQPATPLSPTTLAQAARVVGEAYVSFPFSIPLVLLYAEIQSSVDPESATRIVARLGRGTTADAGCSEDKTVAEKNATRQLSNNADFSYVRALIAYHGNATSGGAAAQSFLKEGLELDPDHTKCQRLLRRIRSIENSKAAGNKAYGEKKWAEAELHYTAALNADATNRRLQGVLYGNRSAARLESGDVNGALADVNCALERGNESAKLYARRSRIYEKMGKWAEAKTDQQKAADIDEETYGGRTTRDFDERMRQAKRKDYYKVLGLERGCNDDDLKKAYRKAALLWHPDKWANSSPAEKTTAEQNFKEVQEAHSLLSDPQKRRLYDSGRLDNESEGVRGPGGAGGGMHPGGMADMSEIFQMFMGGGGMPGMSMGGGMPRPGGSARRGRGGPFGF